MLTKLAIARCAAANFVISNVFVLVLVQLESKSRSNQKLDACVGLYLYSENRFDMLISFFIYNMKLISNFQAKY